MTAAQQVLTPGAAAPSPAARVVPARYPWAIVDGGPT